ncbi:hypothetical protein QBC41DRAFT_308229 [Cercophora samala]|uniref:Uncharacterized protein n=1 Tax=Cercophora samala TaxID=330535 RepID=A0AA39YTG9_9PEZI|nr:hypothetical protein QBC41DRAFT_308229 [Cercophora samala]
MPRLLKVFIGYFQREKGDLSHPVICCTTPDARTFTAKLAMFQHRSLALIGLLGLLIAWIVIGSITEREQPVETTVRAQPPASVKITRPYKPVAISTGKTGSAVHLPLDLTFSRVGKNYADRNLTYSIGIKPVQVEYVDPTVVAAGEVVAGEVSQKEMIHLEDAAVGNSYELSVEVAPQQSGNGALDLRILGKDLVYLTVVPTVDDKKDKATAAVQFTEPAEYWDNWLLDLHRRNQTIPTIPLPDPSDFNKSCSCPDYPFEPAPVIPFNISNPTTPLLLPYPVGGTPPPRPRKETYTINLRVRWEDRSTTPPTYPPMSGATVWIYIQDVTDDSRTTYGYTSLPLSPSGRATKTITLPPDQFIVQVSVAFDNPKLQFRGGGSGGLGRTGGTEYPLPYKISDTNDVTADAIIPHAFGPELVRLWNEFNLIYKEADRLVGAWDIPKLGIQYPKDWSRYYQGQNKIDIWGSVGSQSGDHFAHELGHHFMYSIAGGIPGRGGAHTICGGAAVDIGLAFSEGWATAFAGSLLGRQVIGGWDYGAYSCASDRDTMETSEGRVAAGLMDLIDGGGGGRECNGGDTNLGRDGVCDGTVGGELFTPRLVFRDSIARRVDSGVRAWWGRIISNYADRNGFARGREAMEYNYYPQECLFRLRGVCVRVTLFERIRLMLL